MSNFENIYNQNYGYSVATNGDFISIGNPIGKKYNACEGFSRIGQVFLLRKDTFNRSYPLIKIYTKNANYSQRNTLMPYFTEQSSSATFTASLTKEAGNFNDTSYNCFPLVLEDFNSTVLESNYGSSLDLSDYFLAISDTNTIFTRLNQSYSNFSSVDIYEINPNYSYVNGKIIEKESNKTDLTSYSYSDKPLCSVTGSSNNEKFGYSVSLSNNFLAVGAPYYNSGRGAVYVFKYVNVDCPEYNLLKIITSSISTYPKQFGFGSSVSIDKKFEDKLVIGCNQISSSNVYIYLSSSNWKLSQVLSENTSSFYYNLDDVDQDFIPSGSQSNNYYGYSVSVHNNILAVGAPTDLIYFDYSGSTQVRQRGSVYIYLNKQCTDDSFSSFELFKKIYGDNSTLKDNLLGYSVSVFNDKVLAGCPKPYFPFSSLFLSSSINSYDKSFKVNDEGESTYCGQSLIYKISGSNIFQITSQPISKRKEYENPFNAFGYSVSLSNDNLVIGAPIPLYDGDYNLNTPLITETGSAAVVSYISTSSYQSDSCVIQSKFVMSEMEDIDNCTSGCFDSVVFIEEQGSYQDVSSKLIGKGFIYNFSDLEKNYNIGNIFYNNNKLVINTTGSVLNNLTLDPSDYNYPYLYMDYNSQVTLFEKQYICTIEPGEFNISTNPSAITSSLFEYGVIDTQNFDFNNLDIILRYLNYRISSNKSEKWWYNFVSGDVEESILNFYSSSIFNFNENRLTQQLKEKCSYLDCDVNNDGVANVQDGTLIWKYFANTLTPNNFKDYLNPRAKRSEYDNIVYFLNNKTGKFNTKIEKKQFFDYNYSSSLDPTGSYLAPYITCVGLYSGADLVAIAKLAQPIKNTGEIPINIVAKWDT